MTNSVRAVLGSAALAAMVSLLSGCGAGLKAPGMQIERLRVAKVRVTGLGLEVDFHLRNPNPETLRIERFEYKLKLNGHKLGTGYHAEAVQVPGFGEVQLKSNFDLNFLQLPGTIKAIFDSKNVDADIAGNFYVKSGMGTKKLRFSHAANVPLQGSGGGTTDLKVGS